MLLFALSCFYYGIECRFRFTITIEQQGVVFPSAYGHIAAPRLAVVHTPKCNPADLVTMPVKERKQFSISIRQVFLDGVRQAVRGRIGLFLRISRMTPSRLGCFTNSYSL